jgi:hypothetical protein
MKRKTIEMLLLGLYSVLLVVGLVFANTTLSLLANVVAIFTFILVQQNPGGKVDERDKYIVSKAASLSFQILLAVLIVLDIAHDFVDITTLLSVDTLLTVLVGLGFITYASNHIYYKELH